MWDGDGASEQRRITYRELHREVCRFANVLKARGLWRGDRVTIYLPMIPEAAYAMLACARIGAVHSVVFGGFSADAIADRIQDCDSRCVMTVDAERRAGKSVPLKANVDAALQHCPGVDTVIVIARSGVEVAMMAGRDVAYAEAAADVADDCQPEAMNAEDPRGRCARHRHLARQPQAVRLGWRAD